jgi:hypothetical protein
MPGTAFRFAAIALASLLGGCANYIGNGYANVPLQIVVTPQGKFEILDQPDLGRVAISPFAERAAHLATVENIVDRTLSFPGSNRFSSPGSAYFFPLMEYFAQTGRSCRLIRGVPLIQPQWEFVYSCAPGFDPSLITWRETGFSNAPLPPSPPPPSPPPLQPLPPK